MRILVLGGTVFVSREVCRVAAEQGHQVTALARGRSGVPPPGVPLVYGDRHNPQAYAEVAQESWDAVVDVSYEPGQVAEAARALVASAQRYVYVSSVSAYDLAPDSSVIAPSDASAPDAAGQRRLTEDDTPLLAPLAGQHMRDPEDYGPAKVACERVVAEVFGPGRAVVMRPGIIGGPGDTSGRSAYWPARFASSGGTAPVLVPDEGEQPVQLIDVRDLADFIVARAVAGDVRDGALDVVGPSMTVAQVLDAAEAAARRVRADEPGGEPGEWARVPAPASWLVERGVSAWAGPQSLPLWFARDEAAYPMMRRSGSKARALGLTTRPLEDTFADELATLPAAYLSGPVKSGLTDSQHADLLAQLTSNPRPE